MKLLGPPSLAEAKETVPDSFRAQYSVDDSELNQLHGSDTAEGAAQEINYFFPPEQTVAVIKPSAFDERGELASCFGHDSLHSLSTLLHTYILT